MFKMLLRNFRNKLCKSSNIYKYFNFPLKVKPNEDYTVSEKIIELPFIHGILNEVNPGKKVLDFGCTKSWLSLSLSSIGYNVYGIDLRDYIFKHPNFHFNQINILDFPENEFDYVVSLSVLEHVGLGVYGDEPDDELVSKVLFEIHRKLKTTGKFILTLPLGKESVDEFERSFSPKQLEDLLTAHNFIIENKNYFRRSEGKYWEICNQKEISLVDNSKFARNKFRNGVNGIGCYLLSKNSMGM